MVMARLYGFLEILAYVCLTDFLILSTARLLHFKSILRLQAEDWLMLFLTVRSDR
jgi:hypothetical protein